MKAVVTPGSCPVPHGELAVISSMRDKTRWYRESFALVGLRKPTRMSGSF